ncbi:MAG: hypothetical protein MUF31_08985 [Akkermansiaceae bacterium]|nr:hypothetical protein [Akkermansiaceae bacterium]
MTLRSLLLALLAGCSLIATASSEEKPKAAFQLRLLCVDVPVGAERLVILEKTDEGWAPRWRLKISPSFITDPVGLSGKPVGLAIDPTPPEKDSPFNGPPVAVTEPIEGLKPFHELTLREKTSTLVLVANPKEKAKTEPYRAILFSTDTTRFGAGDILIQNFASTSIAGVLGGKRVGISPGKSAIVAPGADQPADMAQITLASNVDGSPQVFCDTRWPAKTDYRRYLFILPRSDGSLHPFVFPEHPPFP